MMRLAFYARRFGLPLLGAAMCLRMAGDAGARPGPARMAFADAMPKTVVWAWEEPEDLRTADARAVGVAYLDETLLLGEGGGLTVRHRHQPLAVAPGAAVMAVVRIETGRGFADSPGLRLQTADELAEAAQRAGVRTLQVDFDATRSERGFYAAVLRALRLQMPAGMPLSITALASWCGEGGGWLAGLPIDEATRSLTPTRAGSRCASRCAEAAWGFRPMRAGPGWTARRECMCLRPGRGRRRSLPRLRESIQRALVPRCCVWVTIRPMPGTESTTQACRGPRVRDSQAQTMRGTSHEAVSLFCSAIDCRGGLRALGPGLRVRR